MIYQELLADVKQMMEACNVIYVYGAGMHGKEVAGILARNGIKIEGFVVTKMGSLTEVMGLPVICIDEIINNSKAGFVIGANTVTAKEMQGFLQENHVAPSRIVDGAKYIARYRESISLQTLPVLEVNPVLGCSISCKFCPQKLITGRYYEHNHARERIMKIEDFKLFLDRIPEECIINFAGMVEPFLHPQCINLIKMACNSGRKVFLYTTLEGADDADIEELLQLPIQYVCLHVADAKGYAHITTSEEYYVRVQKVLNAVKSDGTSFVQCVSAQAKPVERIEEMCKGRYEVLVSLQDRCGQLEGDELAKRDKAIVDEEIECAFCGPELNSHVVLPDGTMLLCNMDYGLNHVIGNLKENTYDEIHNGTEMRRIRKAMMGDTDIELLCRKCVCAKVKR